MWKLVRLLQILIQRKCLRRITTINDTKIKYIKVLEHIYALDRISFFDFSIEAHHTDLTFADVPEEEVFDITDLGEFRIKLHNWSGKLIDFVEYCKNGKVMLENAHKYYVLQDHFGNKIHILRGMKSSLYKGLN